MDPNNVANAIAFLFLGAVFFLPTVIVSYSKARLGVLIAIVNVLLFLIAISSPGLAILGWFVLLFWSIASDAKKQCPSCAQHINRAARICPHCRTELMPPAPVPVAPPVSNEPVTWSSLHSDRARERRP